MGLSTVLIPSCMQLLALRCISIALVYTSGQEQSKMRRQKRQKRDFQIETKMATGMEKLMLFDTAWRHVRTQMRTARSWHGSLETRMRLEVISKKINESGKKRWTNRTTRVAMLLIVMAPVLKTVSLCSIKEFWTVVMKQVALLKIAQGIKTIIMGWVAR